MKGRPNKPKELKKIEGTYRKDRDRNKAEYPGMVAASPPEMLPEGAKKVWSRIIPQLVETDILKEIDVTAAAMLCVSLDTYNYCTEQIAKMKELADMRESEDHTNHMRKVFLTRKEAFSDAFRLMQDFGLTPVSRQRIVIQAKDDDYQDPLDI